MLVKGANDMEIHHRNNDVGIILLHNNTAFSYRYGYANVLYEGSNLSHLHIISQNIHGKCATLPGIK